MKKWISAALLLLFATTPLFALAGVGAHWSPTFGTEMSGATDNFSMTLGGEEVTARFVRDKAEMEHGFGFKAWLDLPLLPINFEATANFYGTTYGSTIEYKDPESGNDLSIPLNFDMGLPLIGVAEPMFGFMRVDLSAAWRAFDLSLAVVGIQGYIGGGATWNYATRPLTPEVAQEAVEALFAAGVSADNDDALQKALEKAYGDLDSGFGGHLLAGIRAKLLFLSIYANGKYYIGGLPKGIDSGLVLELGGGLGI